MRGERMTSKSSNLCSQVELKRQEALAADVLDAGIEHHRWKRVPEDSRRRGYRLFVSDYGACFKLEFRIANTIECSMQPVEVDDTVRDIEWSGRCSSKRDARSIAAELHRRIVDNNWSRNLYERTHAQATHAAAQRHKLLALRAEALALGFEDVGDDKGSDWVHQCTLHHPLLGIVRLDSEGVITFGFHLKDASTMASFCASRALLVADGGSLPSTLGAGADLRPFHHPNSTVETPSDRSYLLTSVGRAIAEPIALAVIGAHQVHANGTPELEARVNQLFTLALSIDEALWQHGHAKPKGAFLRYAGFRDRLTRKAPY